MMETALYRNRIYRDRLVEAVLYTRDNDREMFEWVPGKQHYEPGGRINGLNIFTPEGRRHAVWGDWVYRDQGTDRFWTTCQDAFDDDYERVHVDLCGRGSADPCFEDDFTDECSCWCHRRDQDDLVTGSQAGAGGAE